MVFSDQPWFIMFYAPWCPHCQSLAPIWNEVFQKHHEELGMAKVDCTDDYNHELCIQFKIGSYPTLVLLNEYDYFGYDGSLDYDAIVQFALSERKGFKESAKD